MSPRSGRPWFDLVVDGFAVVAGVVMVGLTVLVCADVAARYFRLFAMPWSLDVAENALLLVTFLGAPWVLLNHGHISIDIVVDRLNPRDRARMLRASHAVGAVVCAVLFVFAIRVWWASYSQNTMIHETYVYPEWLQFTVPPPIFLMLAWIFVRWLRDPAAATKPAASEGL